GQRAGCGATGDRRFHRSGTLGQGEPGEGGRGSREPAHVRPPGPATPHQDVAALRVLAEADRLLPLRGPQRHLAQGGIAYQPVGLRHRCVQEPGDQQRLAQGAQDGLHGRDVREARLGGAGAPAVPAEGFRRSRQSALQTLRGGPAEWAGALPRTGRAQETVDVHGQDVSRVNEAARAGSPLLESRAAAPSCDVQPPPLAPAAAPSAEAIARITASMVPARRSRWQRLLPHVAHLWLLALFIVVWQAVSMYGQRVNPQL